jgi:hypothetical protein
MDDCETLDTTPPIQEVPLAKKCPVILETLIARNDTIVGIVYELYHIFQHL